MSRVLGPRSLDAQRFAALYASELACYGYLFRPVAGAEFCDGIVVFLVEENNPLKDAG